MNSIDVNKLVEVMNSFETLYSHKHCDIDYVDEGKSKEFVCKNSNMVRYDSVLNKWVLLVDNIISEITSVDFNSYTHYFSHIGSGKEVLTYYGLGVNEAKEKIINLLNETIIVSDFRDYLRQSCPKRKYFKDEEPDGYWENSIDFIYKRIAYHIVYEYILDLTEIRKGERTTPLMAF